MSLVRFAAVFVGLMLLPAAAAEKIVGLPCEGCEAVFEGLPAAAPARSRIAGPRETGSPLLVEGIVRGLDDMPRAGIVVYAYQTNDGGIYPPENRFSGAARRHGTLRGWSTTDASGRYVFETIRPGGYPGSDLPAHIHMHVLELGRCTYYIDDIVFTDDPRLTPEKRRQQDGDKGGMGGRGGSGITTPVRIDGQWRVSRDIVLGRAIPGYDTCGQPR